MDYHNLPSRCWQEEVLPGGSTSLASGELHLGGDGSIFEGSGSIGSAVAGTPLGGVDGAVGLRANASAS